MRQLSANPANIVVGLVRNKSNTDKKVAEDGLKNVTILEADILDLPALQVRRAPAWCRYNAHWRFRRGSDMKKQRAAEKVKALTGGSLDYLINNAAFVSDASGFKTLADL